MAAERLRVLGEDSPPWLIGVFGLIGVLVASASAWLWLGPPSARPGLSDDAAAHTPVVTQAPAPVCPAAVVVPFAYGRSKLDLAKAAEVAAPMIERVTQNAAARLVVMGHADATGQDRNNIMLSYRRARAVADYLVSAGVAADRVRIRAAGSQDPISGLDPQAGDNRRAAIFITGLPGCPDI